MSRSTVRGVFDSYIMPEPNSGCWLWIGGRTSEGYGSVYRDGLSQPAHRTNWERHRGPIPDGTTLDHLCRVRCCVNPAHLEPVPSKVNILRGVGTGAQNARKNTCPQGHAYDITWANGLRACRTCKRKREREWHRAHAKLKKAARSAT